HARVRRRDGARRHRRPGAVPAAHRRLLPGRELRPVRAVPGGDGPPGGGAAAPRRGTVPRRCGGGAGAAGRHRPGHARRIDLRPRPDRRQRRRLGHHDAASALGQAREAPERLRRPAMKGTAVRIGPPPRAVELTINGETVAVPEGSTILDACKALDLDIPTLCWADTLTPKNACRVCMVEVDGARVLAPSCSRKAEPGMVVHTDSPRARHARRLVLEFLGSSVDLSATPRVAEWYAEYGADPSRYGPEAATVAQPAKVDNGLYVRDYQRCILCYKC